MKKMTFLILIIGLFFGLNTYANTLQSIHGKTFENMNTYGQYSGSCWVRVLVNQDKKIVTLDYENGKSSKVSVRCPYIKDRTFQCETLNQGNYCKEIGENKTGTFSFENQGIKVDSYDYFEIYRVEELNGVRIGHTIPVTRCESGNTFSTIYQIFNDGTIDTKHRYGGIWSCSPTLNIQDVPREVKCLSGYCVGEIVNIEFPEYIEKNRVILYAYENGMIAYRDHTGWDAIVSVDKIVKR